MTLLLCLDGLHVPLLQSDFSGRQRVFIISLHESKRPRQSGDVWGHTHWQEGRVKLYLIYKALGRECWGDSSLCLPRQAPNLWLNLLTHEELEADSAAGTRQLRLGAVFQTFPLALLTPRGTQLSGAQTLTS